MRNYSGTTIWVCLNWVMLCIPGLSICFKSSVHGTFFEMLVELVCITLSRSILESIFGLTFIDTASLTLTSNVVKDFAYLNLLVLISSTCTKKQKKAPPYTVPFPERRLLHYVFVRIFYPKDHSKEALNEIALEAIYRLMSEYSMDYASVILNHMYHIANLNRNPSLPYGNPLTCIFTHFRVPLEKEECLTSASTHHLGPLTQNP